MIFDKVCRVAERAMPDLASMLSKSKLFWFDGKPHEFLPKEITDKDMEFLSEQFMLPFPIVAIEDVGSLVILYDLDPGIRGINTKRGFIDVTRMETDISAYDDADKVKEQKYQKAWEKAGMANKDPMTISFGVIHEVKFINKEDFYTIGSVHRIVQACAKARDDDIIFVDYCDPVQMRELGQKVVDNHLRAMLKNAMCAMQEVLYANTPNKFILEESPVNRRPARRGKLSRSNDRPVYTLLKPGQIRSKMEITESSDGEKQTRLFLGRRAHPRTYHDPRYVNMQGKTVMIPAVWPGENTKIVGAKRYKVMLDL